MVRRPGLLKKNDWILTLSLLIFFAAFFFVTKLPLSSGNGTYEIEIRDASGQITRKGFNQEGSYKIYSEDHSFYNEYRIKDGKVKMLDANCRDQLCVHMKEISQDGEMIVCLPHKVYISVKAKKSSHKGSDKEEGIIDAISE